MPFKSKAQRRKFAQLLVEGRISDETYEEWNRSTGGKELPERVGAARTRTARKKSARTTAKKTARRQAAAKTRTVAKTPRATARTTKKRTAAK